MTLRPKSVNDVDAYLKFLLYSQQGEGKTAWTGLNAPKPVWLDFERSSDTLKAMGLDHIDIVEIGPGSKPKEVVDFCKDIEKSDYETIVLDTISTSQMFQLGDAVANSKADHPLIQDYRDSTAFFTDVFFKLQHAKINVVLIAHERTHYEGDLSNRRKVAIGPAVTPALHDAVTQLVSGVFRLQKKQGIGKNSDPTWSMLCNSKGLYMAKNRYNITEVEIENPDWNMFLKGLQNDRT